MADEDLRALRRTWERTRTPEDEARWLSARLRAGELHPSRLELAAHAGHAPALEIHPIRSAPRVQVSLKLFPDWHGWVRVCASFQSEWFGDDDMLLLKSAAADGWLSEEELALRWAADLIDLARSVEAAEGAEQFVSRDACERIGSALARSLVATAPPPEVVASAQRALVSRAATYPSELDPQDVDMFDDLTRLAWAQEERSVLVELCGDALPHLLLAPRSQDPRLERALDLVAQADDLDPAARAAGEARGAVAPVGPISCLCTVWTAAGQRGADAVRATARDALVPWLLHANPED